MSVLRDMRLQLAADLAAVGVTVFPSWATEITLPCVSLKPPLGGVYIEAGPNFREYTVHVDVEILVEHGDVGPSMEALETLIELVVVNSMDWAFGGIEPPAPIPVTESGADYLGTVLHLSKPVHL